jgi:hypothetical protein
MEYKNNHSNTIVSKWVVVVLVFAFVVEGGGERVFKDWEGDASNVGRVTDWRATSLPTNRELNVYNDKTPPPGKVHKDKSLLYPPTNHTGTLWVM